jgi:hypothetical protein
MYARPALLFEASRSALLLRAVRGAPLDRPTAVSLLPNAMRANDLSRRPKSGLRSSPSATYGFDQEPSTWMP